MRAVEQAKEMGISDLNVHTDSQFLINCKFLGHAGYFLCIFFCCLQIGDNVLTRIHRSHD